MSDAEPCEICGTRLGHQLGGCSPALMAARIREHKATIERLEGELDAERRARLRMEGYAMSLRDQLLSVRKSLKAALDYLPQHGGEDKS